MKHRYNLAFGYLALLIYICGFIGYFYYWGSVYPQKTEVPDKPVVEVVVRRAGVDQDLCKFQFICRKPDGSSVFWFLSKERIP